MSPRVSLPRRPRCFLTPCRPGMRARRRRSLPVRLPRGPSLTPRARGRAGAPTRPVRPCCRGWGRVSLPAPSLLPCTLTCVRVCLRPWPRPCRRGAASWSSRRPASRPRAWPATLRTIWACPLPSAAARLVPRSVTACTSPPPWAASPSWWAHVRRCGFPARPSGSSSSSETGTIVCANGASLAAMPSMSPCNAARWRAPVCSSCPRLVRSRPRLSFATGGR